MSKSKNDVAKRSRYKIPDAQVRGILKTVPLFSHLSEGNLARLLLSAHQIALESGEMLFQAGESADRFFVVLDGWVKLYKISTDGNEIIINVIGANNSFGEAAMFDADGFPVSAEAFASANLLSIPETAFFDLFSTNAAFSRSVLTGLSKRLREMIGEVERSKSQNSCERLSHFLLHLCPQDEESTWIKLPFSKGLLASNLGMTQPTLSRGLSRLRRAGLISTSGKLIQILNIKALQRHCLKA